jgi:hypothetical protein
VKATEYVTMRRRLSGWVLASGAMLLAMFAVMAGCGSGDAPSLGGEATKVTPTDDPIGERLFLDTRFSQYFATHMTGINAPLAVGDPVVATVSTPAGVLPGPFAGKAMNCRGGEGGEPDVFGLCGAESAAEGDEWVCDDATQCDADGGDVSAA